MINYQLVIVAVSGFIAVALGAFGAHGLKDRLDEPMMMAFQIGVQYQFYHTFALALTILIGFQYPSIEGYRTAGWLFVGGMLLFSGSLYMMALSGVKVIGVITPIGGACLLIGWLWFAVAAIRSI